MDSTLVALAASGATKLVGLMLTDAWEVSKEKFSRLFRSAHAEEVIDMPNELESSRRELMLARNVGDLDAEEEITAEWQGKFRRALRSNPELVDDLRALLNDISPTSSDAGSIHVEGKAKGHGRVYQQGQGTQINK